MVRAPVRLRILLVYLSCCLLWGSTWAVVAVGLRDLPPLLFAGARMAVAGALLAPFAWRGGARLGAAGWRRVAGLGLLQIAIPYGLVFTGQRWTASGLSAVLFATFPVWVVLIGRLVPPGEALTGPRLAAGALGFAGVAVLQAPRLVQLSVSGPLALASLLIVAGSIVAAVANVLQKRRPVTSPLLLTFGQTLTAGLVLLAASGLLERGLPRHFTFRAWSAVLYLAVFGTALTYLGLYWLLPRVALAVIGTIPLVDTALAVLLGALLLGEPIGWHLAAGGALVLAAAALAGASPSARAPASRRRGGGAGPGLGASGPV